MSSQQWGNGHRAEQNSPKPEICKVGHLRQWLKPCIEDSKEMTGRGKTGTEFRGKTGELEGRSQKRSEKRSESKKWNRKGTHQGDKGEKRSEKERTMFIRVGIVPDFTVTGSKLRGSLYNVIALGQ